ncbi:hypothetical protein [Antrihabitans stalactiti]|uniref:Uncharacterized protein n=1 Tax=Antrihabitans stalactiti TaxID=2584121 RepID=A0A848KKN4_9NOCA|nr:hypothetical protein [Antrihabitans stalactiti]NMN97534.1 hypothetical protein [Antrihabitans stalactiti]
MNCQSGIGAITGAEQLWRLDPDVAALFDDIDEILCEALARRPCPPPSPPITTAIDPLPRGLVPPSDASQPYSRRRRHHTRATQRAPPADDNQIPNLVPRHTRKAGENSTPTPHSWRPWHHPASHTSRR